MTVTNRMDEAAWSHTDRLAREQGLSDADRFALSVGCPSHGNVAMDWDETGVFCHTCEVPLRPWVPVNG
jgi:hypothetical protein